jgi:hypothetical protein
MVEGLYVHEGIRGEIWSLTEDSLKIKKYVFNSTGGVLGYDLCCDNISQSNGSEVKTEEE